MEIVYHCEIICQYIIWLRWYQIVYWHPTQMTYWQRGKEDYYPKAKVIFRLRTYISKERYLNAIIFWNSKISSQIFEADWPRTKIISWWLPSLSYISENAGYLNVINDDSYNLFISNSRILENTEFFFLCDGFSIYALKSESKPFRGFFWCNSIS